MLAAKTAVSRSAPPPMMMGGSLRLSTPYWRSSATIDMTASMFLDLSPPGTARYLASTSFASKYRRSRSCHWARMPLSMMTNRRPGTLPLLRRASLRRSNRGSATRISYDLSVSAETRQRRVIHRSGNSGCAEVRESVAKLHTLAAPVIDALRRHGRGVEQHPGSAQQFDGHKLWLPFPVP